MRFIRLAIEKSLGSLNNYGHGVVVASGKRVVVSSSNGLCPTEHAELVALKRLTHKKQRLKKLTIYIVRWSSGQFRDSTPCFICSRILRSSNMVKTVYFSGGDGKMHKHGSRNLPLNDHKAKGSRCLSNFQISTLIKSHKH